MKLLIVDDNTYVVAGIRVQLDWQALGITEVLGAYSVKEAQRILEKEKIDFLLTDIEMPEEDGFRLIDWIRERGLKTRAVLLTSFAEFKYAERAVSAHVYAYLLKPVTDAKLKEVFTALTEEARREAHDDRLREIGNDWLLERRDSGKSSDAVPARKSPEEIVPEIRAYIRAHLSDCSREALCRQFYLSPDYLSRIFRRVCGVSLISFIQQERMERAKELLREPGGLSISEIAELTGYDSFAHFSKQFRRLTGVSPNAYRRKNAQPDEKGGPLP